MPREQPIAQIKEVLRPGGTVYSNLLSEAGMWPVSFSKHACKNNKLLLTVRKHSLMMHADTSLREDPCNMTTVVQTCTFYLRCLVKEYILTVIA